MKNIFAIGMFAASLLLFFGFPAGAQLKEKQDSLANVFGFVKIEWRSLSAAIRNEASVIMVRESDGQLDTVRSGCVDDRFSFTKIAPGRIYLKVSHVGYEPAEGVYDISAGDNVIYFTLKEKIEELDAAKVEAEVPLMRILQDTTIYNAAAVQTEEGASALEIIRQLPGFEVGINSISVNGRKVARTYVNGVQIFGDNPVKAFSSLLADEVQQVRVYDQQTAEDRFKGLKVSRKERVLDIRTKDPILSLSRILLSASGGVDGEKNADGQVQGRYMGLASAEFYSEMFTLSALAEANNVRESSIFSSSFSPEYLLDENSFPPALSSYREAMFAHLDIDKYWKDREYGNSLGFFYKFEREYARSAQEALTEYFQTDSSPAMTYEDSTAGASVGVSHYFQVSTDLVNTKINDISARVSAKISENRANSVASSLNTVENQLPISQYRQNGNNGKGYDMEAVLSWSKNDNFRFIPSAGIMVKGSLNNSVSWDTDTLASSFTRRQLQSDAIGNGWSVSADASVLSYIVNNDNLSLSMNAGYTFYYEKSRRRQMTFDLIDPANPVQNIPNSYDYTWNMMSNELTVGASLNLPKVMMTLGLSGGRVTQFDEERFPEALDYDRSYNRLTPSLNITYGQHSVDVKCSASQPSIEQTRDRIDDSNPLVLLAGNPDLKQVYTTSVDFRGLILRNRKNGMTWMYWGNFSYDADRIVSKSTYFTSDTHVDDYGGYDVKAGTMMYSYENAAQGAWRANLDLPFSAMFRKAKLNFRCTPSARIESTPQYVGDLMTSLLTVNAGASMSLSWTPVKSLNFSLSPSGRWFDSTNDSGQKITSGVALSGSFGISYTFPFKLWIKTSVNDNCYLYTAGAGTNINTCTLRASVGYPFMKGKLKVSLSGMDLLKRSDAYTTSATSDYFMQSWQTAFGRYFMLNIVYTFRHKGA